MSSTAGKNLLLNALLSDGEGGRPRGWTFAAPGDPTGVRGGGEAAIGPEAAASLVIEHTDPAHGSRWEQRVAGVEAGDLLRFSARVRSEGNRLIPGPSLRLEALDASGQVLASVEEGLWRLEGTGGESVALGA